MSDNWQAILSIAHKLIGDNKTLDLIGIGEIAHILWLVIQRPLIKFKFTTKILQKIDSIYSLLTTIDHQKIVFRTIIKFAFTTRQN